MEDSFVFVGILKHGNPSHEFQQEWFKTAHLYKILMHICLPGGRGGGGDICLLYVKNKMYARDRGGSDLSGGFNKFLNSSMSKSVPFIPQPFVIPTLTTVSFIKRTHTFHFTFPFLVRLNVGTSVKRVSSNTGDSFQKC